MKIKINLVYKLVYSVIISFFVAINVYASDYEAIGIEGKRKQKTGINYKSLKTTLDKHLQENPELFDSSRDKDIIAVLGKTGAGKSTLINYLSGKKLTTEKRGLRGNIITLRSPEDKSAMAIGLEKKSQTHLPQFVDIEDLRFYDLPGLDDTAGTNYEVLNAFFIKQIIENARTTRLIIVAGLDEVTAGRGKSFKDLTNRIVKLLPTGIGINVCSSLVITKTPGVENLIESLLEEVDRSYLSPWLKHSKPRISQMSVPKGDSIDPGEKKPIMISIRSTKPLEIRKLNINALYSIEAFIGLGEVLHQAITDSLEELEKKIDVEISIACNKESLQKINIDPRRFEEAVSSHKLVTILRTFLEEADYRKIFSPLVATHVDTSKTKISLKIKAEQERLAALASAIIPTGSIVAFAGEVAPPGWLLCNGGQYSSEDYPELWEVIKIKYVPSEKRDAIRDFNAENKHRRFCVPDLSKRVIVGVGSGYSLGQVGGEEYHRLTIDELPRHDHSTQRFKLAMGDTWSWGKGGTDVSESSYTGYTGGDGSHNNMQPYQVLNYIIRTGKLCIS